MRLLVVYAHPEPHSFCGALRNTAVNALRRLGHDVVESDLYAMGFNPVGGPGDVTQRADDGVFRYQAEQVAASKSGRFEPALAREMDKLRSADTVLFIFPLWWFSLPAILKGWIDRVFAMGVAYAYGETHENGPLKGKRAMLCLTTGAPQPVFTAAGRNGALSALLFPVQYGMLRFVGMDVLPPFVAWSAARVDDATRASYLAQWEARLAHLATEPVLALDPANPSGGG
jgi:NAD(P)H dehydrogenase (quinone)